MKLYVLASTAFAATSLIVATSPVAADSMAGSSVMITGGGMASSCYNAAKKRAATSSNIELCDRALLTEKLTDHEIMATHVNRGILLMISGNRGAAIADFDAAIAMNPNHPEAWMNKGVVTFDQGNTGSALQLADKAMALGTKAPAIAYYIRGFSDEEHGNSKEAYSNFKRAAELAPSWGLPKDALKRYRVVER